MIRRLRTGSECNWHPKARPKAMFQLGNRLLASLLPYMLVSSDQVQHDVGSRAAYVKQAAWYERIKSDLVRCGHARRDKHADTTVATRLAWADDSVPTTYVPADLTFPAQCSSCANMMSVSFCRCSQSQSTSYEARSRPPGLKVMTLNLGLVTTAVAAFLAALDGSARGRFSEQVPSDLADLQTPLYHVAPLASARRRALRYARFLILLREAAIASLSPEFFTSNEPPVLAVWCGTTLGSISGSS